MPRASEESGRITLCPDYGSVWGLWSDSPPVAPKAGELLAPEHFQFSEHLTASLRNWIDQWRLNYADAPETSSPSWRYGFDRESWAKDGDEIARLIGEELPGFHVDRLYRSYLKDPVRSSDVEAESSE